MGENEKVLVTGASGFIGSHLLSRFRESYGEVHAVSRTAENKSQNRNKIIWHQKDLSDLAAVKNLLIEVKPDVIIHLASHVAGARDLTLVIPTFQSNLITTVNLLAVATEVGCRRIVLTGSMEEPEGRDLDATPSSPYAAAKWACSHYARMFHALYKTPVVALRVFMVYGPAQKDLRKLIPYVILSLLRKEAPRLTNGNREVDWIYVEDVVEAFYRAAGMPGIEGKTIEIGSGRLVSIRKIVEDLIEMINPEIVPLFGKIPERPFEQVRVAKLEDSETWLGWKPSVPLEEGLKKTVEWYKEQWIARRICVEF